MVEATVAEARRALERGELSVAELTETCLHRIAAHERAGACLHALISVNPDGPAPRGGRLEGVPVVVKDVICTADRVPTTGGSLALRGLFAPRDATIVARMRAEGAVILGKANLDELTCGGRGASALGGQTRNAYARDRSPNGSSGGTAVAIAAGYAILGVGTDTCGSIRSPASSASLVGLRPTVGLVSRHGVMPAAPTCDTLGPMTRTVEDAALLLDVIAGPDPRDAATMAAPRRGHAAAPAGYAAALHPDALRGARLGVVRDLLGADARVDAVMEAALRDLAAAGAELVDPVAVRHLERMNFADLPYRGTFEMQAAFDAFLAELGDAAPVRTFAELVRIGTPLADVQERLEATAANDAMDRGLVARGTAWARDGIDAALAGHRLDALVYPTRPRPPEPLEAPGVHATNGMLAALAGYPALTVPAGFTDDGLPVGLELLGPAWSEATLLNLAYAYEQATGHRRPPEL